MNSNVSTVFYNSSVLYESKLDHEIEDLYDATNSILLFGIPFKIKIGDVVTGTQEWLWIDSELNLLSVNGFELLKKHSMTIYKRHIVLSDALLEKISRISESNFYMQVGHKFELNPKSLVSLGALKDEIKAEFTQYYST